MHLIQLQLGGQPLLLTAAVSMQSSLLQRAECTPMLRQSNTAYLSVIQECNMLWPKGFYISTPYQVSQHLPDICGSPAPSKLLLNAFALAITAQVCILLHLRIGLQFPHPSLVCLLHSVGDPVGWTPRKILPSSGGGVCSCRLGSLRSLTMSILSGLAFSFPPSILCCCCFIFSPSN